MEEILSLSDALVKGRIGDGAAPRWVGRREVVRVGRPGRRVPLAVGGGVDTRLAGPAGGRSCHRVVDIQKSIICQKKLKNRLRDPA